MSPEVLVLGGVGGSQKEDYLWEGEAGTEKNKFTVRILDEGQLLNEVLNFLDLLLNLDMDKLLAANRGAKEDDSWLLHPWDPKPKWVCGIVSGIWTPNG